MRRVDTALPFAIGPATKGKPNVEVSTQTIWTRFAGCSLVLYAVEPTDIETLIFLVMTALRDALGVAGNWTPIRLGGMTPRAAFRTCPTATCSRRKSSSPSTACSAAAAAATEQEVIPYDPQ